MLPTVEVWLPALCVFITAVSVVFNWRLHRQLSRLTTQHRGELERLEKQLNMMNSGSIGMGQRTLLLEQKLSQLQGQLQQQHNQPKNDDKDFSYSHALQMFDRGVDAAAVAASCGISRSEAQLMELIRKQVKSSTLMANQS